MKVILDNLITWELESQGIAQIDGNFKPDKSKDIILTRAHGISPERKQTLENYGCPMVDCTCPYVKKTAKFLENFSKNNFDVIVLGDKNHTEIQGLIGYVKTQVHVAQNKTEILEIENKIMDKASKLLLLTQSTLDVEFFNFAKTSLARHFPNLVAINTICQATKARQQGLRDLISTGIDAVVVLGDKTSANTCNLAAIARKYCPHVFHLENIDQAKVLDLRGINTIGVTSGASVPNFLINSIYSYLKTCG
ncbi:MAG: hypothetical protein LBI37_03220 [Puniceicoccales bacterium]|jgi:4-hydroxy-3-methylbut-2-enyl diphosphate reductase|nr:hypothetical protein [Puniceicoccales bacterium]